MRKFLVPILAAASALAVGAPASAQAQWMPPRYNYQPYDYGRGYNYHRFAGDMNARVDRIRRDIREMQQRRILSWQEARSLEYQARDIQRSIYRDSRNGIQPGEARRLENRIRNLEYRISREANDWNNRPGYRRY
jgi:hypothetical protein